MNILIPTYPLAMSNPETKNPKTELDLAFRLDVEATLTKLVQQAKLLTNAFLKIVCYNPKEFFNQHVPVKEYVIKITIFPIRDKTKVN